MSEKCDCQTYRIPFEGHDVLISQGYNGPWSHKKIREVTDHSFSLDFVLPVGTEVLAARPGRVRAVFEKVDSYYMGTEIDFDEGFKYTPNFVEVAHDDGSFACYMHLQKGSVSAAGISSGVYVEQGQVIGTTGLSGWRGPFPHLHFMVYGYEPIAEPGKKGNAMRTRPVSFSDYKGPLEHRLLRGL